ncbi:MAG: 30S ribosomal protein S17 [Anaerolineae bacterium]|nr:30S ribosomal protein S17 [Anaerolineae bacterium]MDK1080883.1 30S ribosomal protein S17 [Anaerolineae bacterium]MDK1118896.1 30S ribosomal protein S17 [Anaerolineae bacterium]
MNKRRRMTGIVVSNKMNKTIVVEVSRKYRHLLYQKVVHSRNRIKAHDELSCQVGDQVNLVESKPISREKHWVVEDFVRREERFKDAGVDDSIDLLPEDSEEINQ